MGSRGGWKPARLRLAKRHGWEWVNGYIPANRVEPVFGVWRERDGWSVVRVPCGYMMARLYSPTRAGLLSVVTAINVDALDAPHATNVGESVLTPEQTERLREIIASVHPDTHPTRGDTP